MRDLQEQLVVSAAGLYAVVAWWIRPMLRDRPMTIRHKGRIRAVRAIQNEVKRGGH